MSEEKIIADLKWLGGQSANWVNIDQAWARKLARDAAAALSRRSPPSPSVGRDEIRREALEEAAKVCENEWRKGLRACSWGLRRRWGAELAAAIRSLIGKKPDLGSPQARLGGLGETPSDELERVAAAIYSHEDDPLEWTFDHALRALTCEDAKGPHSGDCTNEIHTCLRCERERMLKVARAAIAAMPSPSPLAGDGKRAEGWDASSRLHPRMAAALPDPLRRAPLGRRLDRG